LYDGIAQDEIALLGGIGWRCIAILVEWIKEDLSGLLKRDTVSGLSL